MLLYTCSDVATDLEIVMFTVDEQRVLDITKSCIAASAFDNVEKIIVKAFFAKELAQVGTPEPLGGGQTRFKDALKGLVSKGAVKYVRLGKLSALALTG